MNEYLILFEGLSVNPRVFDTATKQPPIIRDVSLVLKEGDWLTLLGSNGSGKSTLAKVIAGFPVGEKSGAYLLGGKLAAYNKPIPIVMQQPEASMLGATPWEDVVLMLEQHGIDSDAIAALAEESLSLTGLLERKDQSVGTLSGGQKQLTAIAGCLAVKAPVLVLDEATAMLDPEASLAIGEQVRELHAAGSTIIWITQKLAELRHGDRVIVMEQGRIVFDGTTETFYERNGNEKGTESTGSEEGGRSWCERLGFEAPYAVQTAWELEKLGIVLKPLPLTVDRLAEALQR
ncbi:energy-coupling factor transport system ATP-binding protein [Paenibacillus algorifonticola]|uniref:Energy-coupling factor transport system ATP-binding protein n=1 Tax=Paenibacillus algorifonticola TaxID=684063 RepID=A0A1I1YFF9_9BACL|nr:ABC transporter ATP-binding protein [Paenibacillus algorifonticola]SFE18052.1 energy-coupling factor transport system ATP-binding protein [Paenibacillus algorifonticola]